MVLGRAEVQHTHGPEEAPAHLDLEGRQVGEVRAVAVEAQGLGEADEEAGQRPGEPGVVMPTDEDEEEHESLDDCKVGLGEKLGLGKRLLDGEAVFVYQNAFLGAKV